VPKVTVLVWKCVSSNGVSLEGFGSNGIWSDGVGLNGCSSDIVGSEGIGAESDGVGLERRRLRWSQFGSCQLGWH